MKIPTVAGAIIGTVLLTATGAAPANAAQSAGTGEFDAFVDTLGLAPAVEAAVIDEFAQLPQTEQAAVLNTIQTAPLSLVDVDAAPTSTLEQSESGQYTATDTRDVSILGVHAGTFTLQYRFEADGTRVTKSLSCGAKVTGFTGWGASASFAFITGRGEGSCTSEYLLAFTHNGVSTTTKKQHRIAYDGTPTLTASHLIDR